MHWFKNILVTLYFIFLLKKVDRYHIKINQLTIMTISKIELCSQFIKLINRLIDYNKQNCILGIQHQIGINQNRHF